jgi:hypothetical protein
MGHEVSRVFKLEWPPTHFLYGALIRMRSAPLGLSMNINASMPWTELVAAMCEHVVEWDLEYEGVPIEIMPEEVMRRVDRPILVAVAKAWQDASAGVTAPLDPGSGDGPAPQDTGELEQSMPMASL